MTSLSRHQRILLAVTGILAGLLLSNALFLLAVRGLAGTGLAMHRDDLPVFYQIALLGHTALGVVAAPLALGFAIWHLRSVWKRRRPSTVSSGVVTLVATIGLLATGLFILTEAASRNNRWAWWAHVGLAAVLPVAFAVHRVVAEPAARRAAVRMAAVVVGVAGVLLAVHVATVSRAPRATGPATVMATVVTDAALAREPDPFLPFVPLANVPVESRFFPSAATTSSGELMPSRVVTRDELPEQAALSAEIAARGFVMDERIGARTCGRCHQDIVEQWAVSAHRFSSMNNPFYRKPFMDLRARPDKGKVPSQWCSGCHEPALMQAGKVLTDFDPDSAEAQAGLTCLACHAIDALHARTGNAAYNLPDARESPYLFFGAKGGLAREIGDLLIKARPDAHRAEMLTDAHRTSEFCSACHKVSLDVPVNGYRWFRGQNEYDAWHDSGVSRNAARTFYLPPVARRCQDCHMQREPAPLGDVAAKNGTVLSHRFLAVNTALPHLRGDADTIRRTEAFLRDGKLRVDIFGMRRLTPAGDERQVIRPLDVLQPAVAPGERIELQIVVRNVGVGHTFPGGTNDSNEGWLEVEVSLSDGTRLLHSGWMDERQRLDPDAHAYTVVMAAHDGTEAALRNPQDFHAPVLVRVIGPGTADVARYQVRLPEGTTADALHASAKLMWRKFKRPYTEYVFAGAAVPDLPVTTIATATITLPVRAAPAAAAPERDSPATADEGQWQRHNDLGIGLLLQGDTRGALRAFGDVARLFPAKPDGFRNAARAHLADGNLNGAYASLELAEGLAPSDPQTAWVWGTVLQEDGRYADAEAAYRRVLEAFPSDRDTWRRLGRTLYLDRRYEDSLAAWMHALRIDPEDAAAHYHRMLCYRALGREGDAVEAEKAYAKYQIDESAQEVTQTLRLTRDDLQRESNPVHVHLGVGLARESVVTSSRTP